MSQHPFDTIPTIYRVLLLMALSGAMGFVLGRLSVL